MKRLLATTAAALMLAAPALADGITQSPKCDHVNYCSQYGVADVTIAELVDVMVEEDFSNIKTPEDLIRANGWVGVTPSTIIPKDIKVMMVLVDDNMF
ncbi:hypothetical protein KC887_04295 [Candidatus Kaiserbacteria bacterium]|nr:hypothetical protein [Candidatus Kaiserbacteria bacterium]